MPSSCDLDNLMTGDQIGYSFRVSVTAANDAGGAVDCRLSITAPHATAINPPYHDIPAGTASGLYHFDLTHDRAWNDDDVDLTLANAADANDVKDSDVASLVDVFEFPGIKIEGPIRFEVANGLRALPEGVYGGTYTPTGANTVIVEIVKKRKGGKKRHRVVIAKQAALSTRLENGALVHTWAVGVPRVAAGNNVRLFFRAHLLDWQGKVISTSTALVE